jgi:sugar O-acyltransferase (sialic acid O-acetyltransferase NeuD family)
MLKQKLLIFPFNGNGLEALDCVDYNSYDFIGFIDDDCQKKSDQYEIFSRAILSKHAEFSILAVPGSPTSYQMRASLISSLNIDPSKFISVVHPSASIGRNVKTGYNCLIMAGVVITSNAQIGNHVCVLPNSVIHHDALVKDYTLVGSNVVIAGGTIIGENCYLGSGTNVINNIEIGANTLVGLGSNVVSSVASNVTIIGNPAKQMESLHTNN